MKNLIIDRIKWDEAELGGPGTIVRRPWHRPTLRSHGAANAETGVNSTTDLDNTFS